MTKQIEQLITPFHLQSLDAQEQIVTTVRYNKYVAKPSMQAKKRKAVKAKRNTVANKLKTILKGLSKEESAALLAAMNKK